MLVAMVAASATYMLLYACIKKHACLSFNGKKAACAALVFLMVGCMPYFWYAAIPNHSYVHACFTYRNQTITLMCTMFAISIAFRFEQIHSL